MVKYLDRVVLSSFGSLSKVMFVLFIGGLIASNFSILLMIYLFTALSVIGVHVIITMYRGTVYTITNRDQLYMVLATTVVTYGLNYGFTHKDELLEKYSFAENKVISYKAYSTYRYSDNGEFVTVEYNSLDTMKTYHYIENNFNPKYMLYNDCVPVVLQVDRISIFGSVTRIEVVICGDDFLDEVTNMSSLVEGNLKEPE